MTYQALYRTYRPRKFGDVIGQAHVVRTLVNSVKQGKIGHAYLFSGPRGTGKTTIARILARAINCSSPVDGEPCDKCDKCKGTGEGLGVLEIDAASHGSVDDMRQLVAQVSQIPLSGGMMVYIIDEVHMLSKEAFNAFLKTLEEPPPHAVFVLATTEPTKLLPTIHSRCQHFAFRRLPLKDVTENLKTICGKEKVGFEENALRLIARAADGSIRDSLSILEQAIAFEPKGLTLKGVSEVIGIPDRLDIRRLAGHIISAHPGALATEFASLIENGREPMLILSELLSHFRDLLFASLDLMESDIALLPDEEREIVEEQAKLIPVERIHDAIGFLAKCEAEIKWEDEAALLLEASLIRLANRFSGDQASSVKVEQDSFEPDRTVYSETRAQAERKIPYSGKPESPSKMDESVSVEKTPKRSLTGGLSLKQDKKAEEKSTPPQVEEQVRSIPEPEITSGEKRLKIQEKIGEAWLKTLETIKEGSITDYILIAESTPYPPPDKWPQAGDESARILNLELRFPSDRGLQVRLINSPQVLNRLTTRLENVLGKPVDLKITRERTSAESSAENHTRKMRTIADGEGPITGTADQGPSLFPGATKEPTDPDLKKIHNLIVDEFPEYRVEFYGPAE